MLPLHVIVSFFLAFLSCAFFLVLCRSGSLNVCGWSTWHRPTFSRQGTVAHRRGRTQGTGHDTTGRILDYTRLFLEQQSCRDLTGRICFQCQMTVMLLLLLLSMLLLLEFKRRSQLLLTQGGNGEGPSRQGNGIETFLDASVHFHFNSRIQTLRIQVRSCSSDSHSRRRSGKTRSHGGKRRVVDERRKANGCSLRSCWCGNNRRKHR